MNPTLRKAAILISSLEAKEADALLDQMGEAQARRVRDAIMGLWDIDEAEQERIIAEFVRGAGGPPQVVTEGVEVCGSLAAVMHSPATAPIPPPQRTEPPFAVLHDVPADMLAKHLLREHPQTMAVVLAHLPPPRAAALLACFPPEVSADVLLRVGEIDHMHDDIVRDIERGLEAALAKEPRAAKKSARGAAALKAILDAAGARPILPSSPPAPVITSPTTPRRRQNAPPSPTQAALEISFAQLAQLDDRAWAKILQATDTQVALLALAGAAPEVVDRLYKQLPPREAQALERKIEGLGPIRLRDVEQAQEQLARVAAQLAARGEIRLPPARRFATAA